MRTTFRLLCSIVTVIVLASAVSIHGQSASLSNGDVVKMVQAGLPESVIVLTIKNAPTTKFEVTPEALVTLKKAGVTSAIMTEIVTHPSLSGGGAVAAAPAASVEFVDVPDATAVKLRLLTPASSATSRPEDTVRFEVIDDVTVADLTVIKKGAAAIGRISEAKKNGSFGRSGKLSFSIDSVASVDGSPIPIRSTRELKGDARVGTTVAAVALVGVFGGFVKGSNIDVPAGTEYTVFTDGTRQVRAGAIQR